MFENREDAVAAVLVLEKRLPEIAERAKIDTENAAKLGVPVARYATLVRVTERAVHTVLQTGTRCIAAIAQASYAESVKLNDEELLRVHGAVHAAIDHLTAGACA